MSGLMQAEMDKASQAKQATAVAHPLDPLTADEISAACRAVFASTTSPLIRSTTATTPSIGCA